MANMVPVLQGVRILFVDDEPDARELVRRVLTNAAAHVTIAASGPEALEAIKSNANLDVILSDIAMPQGPLSSSKSSADHRPGEPAVSIAVR